MHLAFKYTWWMEAMSFYLSDDAAARASHIVARIEIAAVNGTTEDSVSPSSSASTPPSRSTDSRDSGDDAQQQQQVTVTVTGTAAEVVPSPLPAPAPALAAPLAAAPEPLADAELATFMTKRVRADFFNAQIAYFKYLRAASESLTKHSRPARKRALPRLLDAAQPTGLYFPCFQGADEHFRIARVFPDEGVVLNSRDKAPFLLWAEVQLLGFPSASPNIYTAFTEVSEQRAAAYASMRRGSFAGHVRTLSGDGQDSSLRTPSQGQGQGQGHGLAAIAGACAVDAVDAPAAAAEADDVVTTVVAITAGAAQGLDALDTPVTVSVALTPASPAPPLGLKALMLSPTAGPPLTTASSASASPSPSPQPPADAAVISHSASSPQRRQWLVRGLQHTEDYFEPVDEAAPGPVEVLSPNLPFKTRADPAPAQPGAEAEAEAEAVPDPFGESWERKTERLLRRPAAAAAAAAGESPASAPSSHLISVIFKGGDDCRQEVLAMQLITFFDQVWTQAGLPLLLRPYAVLCTSPDSGLIETVPDTCSLDALKKSTPGFKSLAHFFTTHFGGPGGSPEALALAQQNFAQSLAAYSLVSYLLQIKDRHNGNILLDSAGHIVHIDFGFMLSSSPGGNMNFESAPFKLTSEFIEVLGGQQSDTFNVFTLLFVRGFLEARRHAHKLLLLLQVMQDANMLAYLAGGKQVLAQLRARFCLELSEEECVEHAIALVHASCDHWRTVQYDKYQYITNGIM
jgi:hypothetical protein